MSFRSFKDPNSDEARQALLDNRCEKKPKNHRTLKRRKALSSAKRRRIQFENTKRLKTIRAYKAVVKAYWRGEVDGHPPRPF